MHVEIEKDRLDNGLTVCSNKSNEMGSVSFVGSIKAGAIYDKDGKLGTSELVARLLMRGNSKLSASKISHRIEEIGAGLEFTNNDERVKFTAKCHSSKTDELLRLISECIQSPSFPPEQIDLAKAEVTSDLASEEDETRAMAYRELLSLIYGKGKTYGRNSMGERKDLERVAEEDIRLFFNEHYGPNSTLIVATGNIDHSDLVSKIDSLFGKWDARSKVNESLSPMTYSKSDAEKVKLIRMPHKSQVDIAMGLRAVPRKSEDYYPLALGSLLFGQIGLYGRLGRNIREERGLAYYSYSSIVAKSFSGHFGIFAGVNPKNTVEAISGVTEEISKIRRDMIGEDELDSGKHNTLGALSVAMDTSSERISIIHEVEYYGLGPRYFEDYEKRINSITNELILKKFQEYVMPEKIVMTIAGPFSDDKIKGPGEILDGLDNVLSMESDLL